MSEQPRPSLETLKPKVKTVFYEGIYAGSRAEVAYMIQGNKIIFSATGKTEGYAPSTITTPEKVIKAISEAENLDWHNFTFYDLQTSKGYTRHDRQRTYALDELVITPDGDFPRVTRWNTLADTDLGIGKDIFDIDGFLKQLPDIT